MKIEEAIKQKYFSTQHQKATINILYTASWIHSQIQRRLKPFGISPEQFNILRILRGQYPVPSSLLLLADRMLDKSSNASRIVEKLRIKGLVTRNEHAKDRRCVEILITERGLALLQNIDQIQVDGANIGTLSDEEAALLSELLDKYRG